MVTDKRDSFGETFKSLSFTSSERQNAIMYDTQKKN